jgi:glycine amidinotransferase
MKWEAAPKPRLTDRSYKEGYLSRIMTIEDQLKPTAAMDFVTTEVEPLFDAAELSRMGKDVVVQHGFTANLAGIDWLRRHFPDPRIHAMDFPGDPYPIHIDCTFVALRPGLILNNPTRKAVPEQRKLFEQNGWQIVEAARPAHTPPPLLCYASVWLSMNALVLDPKTVCVEAREVHQMEQLDKLDFEVLPVALPGCLPLRWRPPLRHHRRPSGRQMRGLLPQAGDSLLALRALDRSCHGSCGSNRYPMPGSVMK